MKKITHKVTRNTEIINGTVPIYINKDEYINIYPFTETPCEWLNIIDKNINFDTEQIFNIRYTVDTTKIKSRYERVKVILNEQKEKYALIEIFIIPDFKAELDRDNFSYTDEGQLTITNNTGKSCDVEVYSSENFVKFGNRRKKENIYTIPFDIKVPVIQKTQADIAGKPHIKAEITVNFVQNGKKQSKILNITAGTVFDVH